MKISGMCEFCQARWVWGVGGHIRFHPAECPLAGVEVVEPVHGGGHMDSTKDR